MPRRRRKGPAEAPASAGRAGARCPRPAGSPSRQGRASGLPARPRRPEPAPARGPRRRREALSPPGTRSSHAGAETRTAICAPSSHLGADPKPRRDLPRPAAPPAARLPLPPIGQVPLAPLGARGEGGSGGRAQRRARAPARFARGERLRSATALRPPPPSGCGPARRVPPEGAGTPGRPGARPGQEHAPPFPPGAGPVASCGQSFKSGKSRKVLSFDSNGLPICSHASSASTPAPRLTRKAPARTSPPTSSPPLAS